MSFVRFILWAGLLSFVASVSAFAQEAYFITYSHQMEEPGDLEIETKSVTSTPDNGNSFVATALEFEYGVKAWWTSELYLEGQTTQDESTVFTGFRLENRFRPLMREHWINPVLYFEFENINSADKILLEIVGHDGQQDLASRNDRSEKKREGELRLILSSNFKGWNVSENFIAEMNFNGGPWEFGYAVGASRPLSTRASASKCAFCRENFDLGAEMYGGLGDSNGFGTADTSHYFAPVVNWRVPNGITLKVSPGVGLNGNSLPVLVRFGVSYEIEQIFSKLRGR